MGISRSQLMAGVAGVAAVLAVWGGGGQYFKDPRHEENVSNSQRLRDIHGEITRHGGSCSDGDSFLNGQSSVRYHDRMNKFSVGFDKTGTVVASQGDAKGPALLSPIGSHDIPKVLSFMERAVYVLCPDSPKNNTQPVQSSGSVALGFLQWQGNTNG